MIRITFECSNVDEAIMLLAKHAGVPVVADTNVKPSPRAKSTGTSAPKNKRGRPLKDGKPTFTPEEQAVKTEVLAQFEEPTKNGSEMDAVAQPPVPVTESPLDINRREIAAQQSQAGGPSLKDVQDAVTRLFDKQGMGNTKALLKNFSAERISELSSDRYAEFIAAVDKQLTPS